MNGPGIRILLLKNVFKTSIKYSIKPNGTSLYILRRIISQHQAQGIIACLLCHSFFYCFRTHSCCIHSINAGTWKVCILVFHRHTHISGCTGYYYTCQYSRCKLPGKWLFLCFLCFIFLCFIFICQVFFHDSLGLFSFRSFFFFSFPLPFFKSRLTAAYRNLFFFFFHIFYIKNLSDIVIFHS